jgi:chromosome partitioning protein
LVAPSDGSVPETAPPEQPNGAGSGSVVAPLEGARPERFEDAGAVSPVTAGAVESPLGRPGFPASGSPSATLTNDATSGRGEDSAAAPGSPRSNPMESRGADARRAGSAGHSTSAPSFEVGWFSSDPDPARFSETLSERLSAERPVGEPPSGEPPSGEPPSGEPPSGEPSSRHGPTADDGGSDVESAPGSTAVASGPAAPATSPQALRAPRGPELIETGMVYVDPDPEVDPSPPPAGQIDTSEPPASSDASSFGDQSGVQPGESPREHPSTGHPASRGAGSIPAPESAADTSSPALSSLEENPWGEPALPMAWPPADPRISPEASERREETQEEVLHPPPDPSWPRLFGQVSSVDASAGSALVEPEEGHRPGQDRATAEELDPAMSTPGMARTGRAKQATAAYSTTEDTQGPPTSRASRQQVQAASDAAGRGGQGVDEAERPSEPPIEIDLTTPASRDPGDAMNPDLPGPGEGSVVDVSGAVTRDTSPEGTEEHGARAPAGQHPSAAQVLGEDPSAGSGSSPSRSRMPGAGGPDRDPTGGTRPRPEAAAEGGFDASSGAVAEAIGAQGTDQANMAVAARRANAEQRQSPTSDPGGARSANVSRETSVDDGGGQMDRGREEAGLEDEAVAAVREAVSRAVAETSVDVSRETDPAVGTSSGDDASEDSTFDSEAAARNARVTFRIHREALNGHRQILAVANQKGGVGKSTTAVNLGAYLALAGARVLVVDLDPQGNASTGLGLDHREVEPSIYDVLTGDTPPSAAIRPTGVANLHIMPSTIDLAGAEVELVSAMSRETRLRRALQSIDEEYDTVLIDCPPSLGLLTVNALAAADELVIPIQCEYYALEGLGQLLRNVELVRANLNPDLRIGGIVLTMYDSRTRLALQVVEEVRKHFSDVVYQTVVPRSVRLSEAPGYGLPIALYDPLSRGGIAYRDLTFELAERIGLLAPTGEGAS